MVRFRRFGEHSPHTRCWTCSEGPVREGDPRGRGNCIPWRGPRGELSYYIKTDAAGRIVDISIQTPSIMNIEIACHYLIKGVTSLADVTSTF